MWDLIGDILTGVATGLSGTEGAAPSKPGGGKPSGLGLPVAIVGALGVVASVCAMFFQHGNLWQIAKLLLLAAIMAVFSAAGFHAFREARRVRARQRAAAGLCAHCGYDLRGNTSGVCPKCGVAPSKLGKGG